MKLSKSLLLIPAASFLLAVAVGSGACSSSLTLSTGEDTYDGTFSGLPSSCSGDELFLVSGVDGVCDGSDVYVACDGSTYGTDYFCSLSDATAAGYSIGGVGDDDGGVGSDDSGSGSDDSGSGSDDSGSGSDDSGSGSDDSGSGSDDSGSGSDDAGGGGSDDAGK